MAASPGPPTLSLPPHLSCDAFVVAAAGVGTDGQLTVPLHPHPSTPTLATVSLSVLYGIYGLPGLERGKALSVALLEVQASCL